MLATFTVNSNLDNTISDAFTTLREAVLAANQFAGNDIIQFASNLNGGTINLNPNLGSLVVTNPVNIVGPSNKVTIQPQIAPTVPMYGLDFNFVSGSAQTLVVSDVVVSGFTSGIRVANIIHAVSA
jgi:hypothetical protein